MTFLSGNGKELGGYTGQEPRKRSELEKLIWDLSKETGEHKFTEATRYIVNREGGSGLSSREC